MILKVVNKTGDTVVDTAIEYDLAADLFKKAVANGMWGKGVKNGKSELVTSTTEFDDLDYDELIMLPRQVGG